MTCTLSIVGQGFARLSPPAESHKVKETSVIPVLGSVDRIDVYSDPVEGIMMLRFGMETVGGARQYDRLSGECVENEYRSVGSQNFGHPGSLVRENYGIWSTWRQESLETDRIEWIEVLHRRTRSGTDHAFQIRLR